MTHEQKINYMRIALGVCGYGIDSEKNLDILVSTYELVLKKEGKTSVEDALEIKHEVENRANVKERQKLLDKVSEKV